MIKDFVEKIKEKLLFLKGKSKDLDLKDISAVKTKTKIILSSFSKRQELFKKIAAGIIIFIAAFLILDKKYQLVNEFNASVKNTKRWFEVTFSELNENIFSDDEKKVNTRKRPKVVQEINIKKDKKINKLFLNGIKAAKKRDFPEAIKNLEQSLELGLKSEKKQLQAIMALTAVHMKQKNFNRALNFANQYTVKVPNKTRPYLVRPKIFMHLKNFQGAHDDSQKACDLGNKKACKVAKKLKKILSKK